MAQVHLPYDIEANEETGKVRAVRGGKPITGWHNDAHSIKRLIDKRDHRE